MERNVIFLLLLGVALGGELYDKIFKNEISSSTGSRRVSFSRGKKGYKKDDLVLSDEQNDWLFGENQPWLLQVQDTFLNDTSEKREKRAGTKRSNAVNYWSHGVVPYVINQRDFTPDEARQLRQAMDVYEEHTCLKFIPRTRESQWVYIHHTDDGCFSLLGNAVAYEKGPQRLSLQKPGCRQFGTYLHELGHAIGLVHEHQLPTRDKYVRYYGTNVDPTNADQLEKYHPRVAETFNTPYDLGSIMHYDIMSFSIDDVSPTLGVDNPWLAQHIGRRYSDMLSFGDVRTVNRLYQCAERRRCTKVEFAECTSPGFLNEKCLCVTPRSYHNEVCEDRRGYESFCQRLAPTGNCDITNIDHHKICKKSCGFCPIFIPGNTAIGPVQKKAGLSKACFDRYFNPRMCKLWAAQKMCNNRWMHRYCRQSCGQCQSQWGDCPNYDPDSVCDKGIGHCKSRSSYGRFMRIRCQDTCGTCGARSRDMDCRNRSPDKDCEAAARNTDACETNPLVMFKECPSTCNRCYWNKGECRNRDSDKDCIGLALSNLCIRGKPEAMAKMRRFCARTCDSCANIG